MEKGLLQHCRTCLGFTHMNEGDASCKRKRKRNQQGKKENPTRSPH